MTTTCPACEGTRIKTILVPNIKKYGGVEYHSSNPPMVPRNFQCDGCDGTGVISDLALARLFAHVSTDQLVISDRAAQS